MKENCLSLILLVCALNFGFGQIYTEDFTGQNGKGAIGPIPTFDLSDVTWSVDVSEANLSETTDWFQVVNEVFEGRDLDGNAYWHSPVIDISSYTNVSFSLDAIENGDHENIDIINTAYRINGGIWLQASANGNLVGNFNSAVVSQTGLNGSTLEVRVNMTNNADNENLRIDNVLVDGTLSVPCTHTITSFSPIEGPEGAEVTITGSGYTPTSTVNFNGVAASSIQYINANTLIATVPNGITTGSISVIESACTETGSDFTIIDFSGSCSSPFSDLIISEVYDSNSGSLGYIEIYNGTGATIDLSDYEVDRYATLGGAVTSTYTFPALNINDGQVLVGKVSNDPNAPSITPDFTFGNLSGFNDDDRLELVFSATNTIVDDWHDDTVPGGTGFSYLRNTNITGPNPTYNASEWVGNGTEDTSDLGNYSISIVGNPSVTSQPIATASCLDYTFSITAMPGNSGTLTYQWRFNDGNANNWQDVNGALLAPATVAGETTNTLSVSGIDLESYQFYCVVTEDASCSIASNAVK
ncbi:lamin tail domain-containing protein, partial [Winogradskyella sp.]|uniref:lamin tail domain-containing protein n=1 Tax=Winogradskyella sp. TaxID=1883156 RepID=UPI0025FF03CD